MDASNEPNQDGMTMEIQCRFITGMPERYHVSPVEISLSTESKAKDLTKIIK